MIRMLPAAVKRGKSIQALCMDHHHPIRIIRRCWGRGEQPDTPCWSFGFLLPGNKGFLVGSDLALNSSTPKQPCSCPSHLHPFPGASSLCRESALEAGRDFVSHKASMVDFSRLGSILLGINIQGLIWSLQEYPTCVPEQPGVRGGFFPSAELPGLGIFTSH